MSLVSWAYATSLRGVFVFDDVPAIVESPHLKTLWPVSQAMQATPGSTLSGRPVASLTFAIDYALVPRDLRDALTPEGPGAPGVWRERFERNLRRYHLTNVTIHLFAALALFGVIRRTLLSSRLRGLCAAASAGLAAAVALVWLVHPLQTASVTYLVQRAESLMGLFYLLTLYCAIRADQAEGGGLLWIAASVAACALGMGSKEIMVTAPAMVALWLVIFGRNTLAGDRTLRLRRAGLLAGLASTWLLLGWLIFSSTEARAVLGGLGVHTGVEAMGPQWSPWSYLLTQSQVVLHYLRLTLVPTPLVFDYYGWSPARTFTDAAPHVLALGLLAIATLALVWRRHPAGFAGAWFFGILAPTSSFIPIGTEVAAEHRMYLPLAAVIAGGAVGLYAATRRLAVRLTAGQGLVARSVSAVGWIAVAVVVMFFSTLTRDRNRDYWSDEALWRDTVEKRPTNARARINYGINLVKAGRYPDAVAQMRTALGLEMDPATRGKVHLQLGAALCAQQRCGEGLPHIERALALNRDSSDVYAILGQAHFDQGDLTSARRYFLEAAARRGTDARVLSGVAWFLATVPDGALRDPGLAIELADRAVRLTGRQDPIALDTLAAAYGAAGRFAEAVARAREALILARRAGLGSLAEDIAQRLAFYEARVLVPKQVK